MIIELVLVVTRSTGLDSNFFRGCSSAGRAPDLHSGGRRFDPDQLHQIELDIEAALASIGPTQPIATSSLQLMSGPVALLSHGRRPPGPGRKEGPVAQVARARP